MLSCNKNSHIKQFPCGEFEFTINEDISNANITILQSFQPGQFNEDLLKLQIVCEVIKQNNPAKIIYSAPFLPYTRQEIIIAKILNSCGINELITYDIHSDKFSEFFHGKISHLSMIPTFIKEIKKMNDQPLIVLPDYGAETRFLKLLHNHFDNIITIKKSRINDKIIMSLEEKIHFKTAIIIDDIIDTGKTICEASKILYQNGVEEIYAYCAHGILSGNAVEKIQESHINKLNISNSIEQKITSKKLMLLIWIIINYRHCQADYC